MDDPLHSKMRSADLDNFRKGKWGRTRSYTYGDVSSTRMRPTSLVSGAAVTKQSYRNTAPSVSSGSGSLYAAASAARSRRVALQPSTNGEDILATLAEHDADLDPDSSASIPDHGLGDSPCPPAGVKRGSGTLMMKLKNSRDA